MANKWINYVYEETDYRRGDLAVAHKLADAANAHTDECTLKLATIAVATRIGERHITRILQHLEADGFVKIVRRLGRGNAPTFKLQKVTSRTPFKDRKQAKKVTSRPPIKAVKGDISDSNKKVTFETKGDISDIEKVTLATSAPYIEPLNKPKEETADKPPVLKVLSDHERLMAHHATRLGRPIPDGGAQGAAIKWLLKHYSPSECLGYYDYQVCQLQVNGGWRDSVSWLTVKTKIAEWVNAGCPKVPLEQNGKNGTGHSAKRTPAEVIAGRSYR